MKTTWKRGLSLLLALVMCLSLMQMAAFADEGAAAEEIQTVSEAEAAEPAGTEEPVEAEANAAEEPAEAPAETEPAEEPAAEPAEAELIEEPVQADQSAEAEETNGINEASVESSDGMAQGVPSVIAETAEMAVLMSETYSAASPSSIYLTQETTYTCTLASAAMMLRSRMYLSNNNLWSSITESSIKSVAWSNGVGLNFNWSYTISGNTMTVSHAFVSGISVSTLKSLLNNHPEGIELYVSSIPHAVLVTDYEGDTFYCADPASGYSGKRIPLSSSYLGAMKGNQTNILSAVTAYWYISSYSIKSSDTTPPTISNVVISDVSSSGYTITCTVTDNVGIDRVQFPTWTPSNGQDDLFSNWQTNSACSGTIKGNTVTYRVKTSDHNNETGWYATHIYAYDTSGNVTSKTDINVTVPAVKANQTLTYKISASSIAVGNTATITASGVGTLSYKSSNTNVATVSSKGVVTGKSSGTATITITASGNNNYNAASATLTVKVTNSGSVKTGWQKIGNAWYYMDANGVKLTGSQYINGAWYYLGNDGKMRTGSQYINGAWYYLGTDGRMCTGSQKINGYWYYLGNDGKMRTGSQYINGAWYYLGNDGKMRTGSQYINGAWYYLGNDGKMRTGWQTINGKTYYLGADGKMRTGAQKINGTWYSFNSYGALIK